MMAKKVLWIFCALLPAPIAAFSPRQNFFATNQLSRVSTTISVRLGAEKEDTDTAKPSSSHQDDEGVASLHVVSEDAGKNGALEKKAPIANELGHELLEAVRGAAMEGAKVMGQVGKGLFAEHDERTRAKEEKKDEPTKELLEAVVGATVAVGSGLCQALRSTAAYSSIRAPRTFPRATS